MPLPLAAIAALSALGAGGLASTTQGGRDFLFGKDERMDEYSLLDPQQQGMQAQLTQGLGGQGGAQMQGLEWLQKILSGDPQAMRQFEAPMTRQFEQQTVPGIAERFAGMGSHGSQNSSGQNLAMAQAGRELSENLGSMRGQLQMGAMNQLQGFMGQARQPTFFRHFRPETGGFMGGMAPGVGQGMSQAGMAYLTGGL